MDKKKPFERKHGTNKTYMPRVRKEFVDIDYLKDLPEKERRYMEKFLSEYYGGSLSAKEPHKNIHKTKKRIKDCFDRNNRQNNDLFGVTKANGLLDNDAIYKKDTEKEYVHPANQSSNITEDSLIEYIDNKELLEYDEKELGIIFDNFDFAAEGEESEEPYDDKKNE